jgi:hypothetical protein
MLFQGYTNYTFSARSVDGSMAINKFRWFVIPETNYHLHIYFYWNSSYINLARTLSNLLKEK